MANKQIWFRQYIRLGIVAATSLVMAGCIAENRVTQRETLSVKGRIVFVPLRDSSGYYYDSANGVAVANAAVEALATNARRVSPVPYGAARGVVRSGIMEQKVDWQKAGQAAKADFVVYGSIDEISWKDPDNPGIPKCIFTITYSVYNVAKGADIYGVTLSGRYPFLMLADQGITVYEMGAEGLKKKSLVYIGQVMSRTFYSSEIHAAEKDTLVARPRKLSR
jgi:hypothetical protein